MATPELSSMQLEGFTGNFKSVKFLDELYEVLTNYDATCPFKLSQSVYGNIYISSTIYVGSFFSSLVRTVTLQPTLLQLFATGLDKPYPEDIQQCREMGDFIGHFFFEKLQLIQEEDKRENVRKLLSQNIVWLNESYKNQCRKDELQCLKSIGRYVMNSVEYFPFITAL